MSSEPALAVFRDRRAFFSLTALLLVAALASAAFAAAAPEPVGRVVRTLGTVEAVAPDGSTRRLGRQDPIFEGDTLRTGARGRAQIRFTDRGLMSLRPDTELAIDDYEFDARSPSTARQELSLRRGGFRAATGRVADNNRAGYRVSTPLAVVGVRGTIWDGYQTPGGALLLGVDQGGIEATTSAGRIARLGRDSGFNFARINMDGSVDYLIQTPSELSSSAGLDEGEDEGEDGGDSGDGGDSDGGDSASSGGGGEDSGDGGDGLGSTEDSSVASGGGSADSTAGTTDSTGTSSVVSTTTNPESSGSVSQSESGTGSVATEEPIPGVDFDGGLTPAEQTALIDDTAVAVGVSLEGVAVASGIGTVTSEGVPVIAASQNFAAFGPGVGTSPRSTVFEESELLIGSLSGSADVVQNFRGVPGLTWGAFEAPVTIFERVLSERETDPSGALLQTLDINQDLLFAIGTPTDIASFMGSSSYRSTVADVRTSGLTPIGVFGEANLDFATGQLGGVLDVLLRLPGESSEGDRDFTYLVDFQAFVSGGLLRDTSIIDGRFQETTEGSFDGQPIGEPIDATISGFVTGAEAEFLQLAFAYSTEARSDAAVSGLALFDTPRLLAAEQAALDQGFFYVGAFGLFETGVAGGRAADARANAGNTLLSFNVNRGEGSFGLEPLVPGQPGFLRLPPDFVIRNSGTVTSFVSDLTAPGAESLAAVVWTGQGPSEFSGTGIDTFDAATGSSAFLSFDTVHFVTGQTTPIADLTGNFVYQNASLLTSALYSSPFSTPTPLSGIDLFFAVDFGTGEISGGTLDLFAGGPEPFIGVLFDGVVSGEGEVNGADLNILSGFFGLDGGIDTGRSEIGGFFAGATGEAFAGAFSLYETSGSGAALGTLLAEQAEGEMLLPLTPAESTRLREGFGYAEAAIGPNGVATFKGLITDPRVGQPSAIVIAGGGLSVLDPVFNDIPPENVILRPDQGVVQSLILPTEDFDAELTHFTLQGFAEDVGLPGGPIGIYDSVTGERIEQISDELLILTGRIADVANLSGSARFSLQSIPQGIFSVDGGPSGSLVSPGLQDAASLSFLVDFNSGAITGGVGRIFTDVGDISFGDPTERDRVEFFFDGVVGTQNGNAFADLFVSGGFVLDQDADSGGTSILDPMASSLSGFFAGDGNVFNAAFGLTTIPDPQQASEFIGTTRFVGNAILTRDDLALQIAEQSELGLGFVFVSAECCGTASSTGAGVAGDPARIGGDVNLTNGDFILGVNTDGMGRALTPVEGGFLDTTPEEIARRLGAGSFVIPDFPVPPEAQLVVGGWFPGGPGVEGAIIDAASGEIIESLDRSLLFMVGKPSTLATLQARGFATFAGDSSVVSPIIMDTTLGGLIDTDLQTTLPMGVLDPNDVFIGQEFINGPEAAVSFNVDFGTGSVTNGHLFTALIGGTADGYEAGLELFFDGDINLFTGGNPFVEVAITGGSLGGRIPLDMSETDIEIFFIGDGPENSSSIVAIGSYTGVTTPTSEFPDPITVAGTFSIGSDLLPETRLNSIMDPQTLDIIDDAGALDSGRLGIVTFTDTTPFGGILDLSVPAGADGLLIGRASAATGNDFILGANRWEAPGRDPVSGDPFGVVRTERRGFFSQPYDFIVRQGANPVDPASRASETLFTDVTPTGGPSFAAQGFDIAWGIWDSFSTSSAVIQDDAADASSQFVFDRNVMFASINPTPQSQLPITGQFTYTSLAATGFGSNFIGAGSGPFNMTSGSELGLDYVTASFDLDFATGDINNGVLETGYSLEISQTQWSATFDGFVNGALLDLSLQSLTASEIFLGSPGAVVPGDLGLSEIGGVLTGPTGERAVLGFNFTAQVGPGGESLPTFEAVSGMAILDRMPSGAMRPGIPPPPLGEASVPGGLQ